MIKHWRWISSKFTIVIKHSLYSLDNLSAAFFLPKAIRILTEILQKAIPKKGDTTKKVKEVYPFEFMLSDFI